jgi:conserved oligomeric Golgi complex subunit 1
MAAELPDSTDFKSWEDAFLHPIPTVHRLEQQLRAELTTNQQKLRTLVG